MKIKGKTAGVHEKPIVIPRPDGDVVIIAKAIQDTSLFEKMCPPPEPRAKKLPNGQVIPNYEDKNYQNDLNAWAEKKTAWYVIKSITEGTSDLEWEKVDVSDHTTWKHYKQELRDFGFSAQEINHVIAGVLEANALNELAFEAARKRFLASRQEHAEK